MDRVIITVAPTSNFQGKEAKSAFPFSPQESADALALSWGFGPGRFPDAQQTHPADVKAASSLNAL